MALLMDVVECLGVLGVAECCCLLMAADRCCWVSLDIGCGCQEYLALKYSMKLVFPTPPGPRSSNTHGASYHRGREWDRQHIEYYKWV